MSNNPPKLRNNKTFNLDQIAATQVLKEEAERLDKACGEWAETSQTNYLYAKLAEARLTKAIETAEKSINWLRLYGALATLKRFQTTQKDEK